MSKRRASQLDDLVINNNKRLNTQTIIQTNSEITDQSVNQPNNEPSNASDLSSSGIHFIDCCNCRVSLHLHRLVLASMSKYFETLSEAEDKTPSKCEITAKCTEHGHRCFSWDGSVIGGEQIGAPELTEFFRSFYRAFDGSGRSKSLLDEDRENMLYNIKHSSIYLYIVKDAINAEDGARETRYDCWDYHGAFELVHKYGLPPVAGTTSFFLHDDRPMNWLGDREEHLNYHLANYFQCDSLMNVYENTAIEVIKKMIGRSNHKGFTFAWLMLGIADKYRWKDLRSHCLSVVALDYSCRSRPNWKRYATNLHVDTLADAFATCAKRR